MEARAAAEKRGTRLWLPLPEQCRTTSRGCARPARASGYLRAPRDVAAIIPRGGDPVDRGTTEVSTSGRARPSPSPTAPRFVGNPGGGPSRRRTAPRHAVESLRCRARRRVLTAARGERTVLSPAHHEGETCGQEPNTARR